MRGKTNIQHTAKYRVYGDGTIIINNTVDILDESITNDISWIGVKTTVPDIVHIDWYGSKSESPVEISKISTSELSDAAGKSTVTISDLRWIGLTGKFCRGIFWSSKDNNLTAEVSINGKRKVDCLLGRKISKPAQNKTPIEFSVRMHRYDTVLGFPDKLWHLDIPNE